MLDVIKSSPPRLALFAFLGVLALISAGCAKKERPAYPVKGQVVVGLARTPAEGAMVLFNPVAEMTQGEFYKPVGTVDAQGRFSLTTRKANDGAPAGEYVITIVWQKERKTRFEPVEEDRLEGAYADPKTSKLRFTVQAGANNEVPVIELP